MPPSEEQKRAITKVGELSCYALRGFIAPETARTGIEEVIAGGNIPPGTIRFRRNTPWGDVTQALRDGGPFDLLHAYSSGAVSKDMAKFRLEGLPTPRTIDQFLKEFLEFCLIQTYFPEVAKRSGFHDKLVQYVQTHRDDLVGNSGNEEYIDMIMFVREGKAHYL